MKKKKVLITLSIPILEAIDKIKSHTGIPRSLLINLMLHECLVNRFESANRQKNPENKQVS